MSRVRWAGVCLLLLGGSLLLMFISIRVNPSVTAADFGLLSLLLGVIVILFSSMGPRSKTRGTLLAASLGWLSLGTGSLAALGGFLLENQVSCSCPATGPCQCGVLDYGLMVYVGIALALIGMTGILLGRSKTDRR
jgi:hypothetical protein